MSLLVEFDSSPFFDTFQRSDREVLCGEWHSDATWFGRVLELLTAPRLRDLEPAIRFKFLEDLAAVHRSPPSSA
jgi:hypothetical protein